MADEPTTTDEDTATVDDVEETADLGEAGKKALAEERQARKAADRQLRQMARELEQLRESAMSEQEKAIAQARREAAEEVRAEMGRSIVAAKLTAAAAGRMADPEDATAFIDISELEDDPQAIRGAIDALLERKPHLAASATRSTGFDAGARGSSDPTDMNSLIRRQAGRS